VRIIQSPFQRSHYTAIHRVPSSIPFAPRSDCGSPPIFSQGPSSLSGTTHSISTRILLPVHQPRFGHADAPQWPPQPSMGLPRPWLTNQYAVKARRPTHPRHALLYLSPPLIPSPDYLVLYNPHSAGFGYPPPSTPGQGVPILQPPQSLQPTPTQSQQDSALLRRTYKQPDAAPGYHQELTATFCSTTRSAPDSRVKSSFANNQQLHTPNKNSATATYRPQSLLCESENLTSYQHTVLHYLQDRTHISPGGHTSTENHPLRVLANPAIVSPPRPHDPQPLAPPPACPNPPVLQRTTVRVGTHMIHDNTSGIQQSRNSYPKAGT